MVNYRSVKVLLVLLLIAALIVLLHYRRESRSRATVGLGYVRQAIEAYRNEYSSYPEDLTNAVFQHQYASREVRIMRKEGERYVIFSTRDPDSVKEFDYSSTQQSYQLGERPPRTVTP